MASHDFCEKYLIQMVLKRYYYFFFEMRIALCCPHWSQNPGLKWFSCLSLQSTEIIGAYHYVRLQEILKYFIEIIVSLVFGLSQYNSSFIPLNSIQFNPNSVRMKWILTSSLAVLNVVGLKNIKVIRVDHLITLLLGFLF